MQISFNDEQLKQIEELAAVFFSPQQIAVFLQLEKEFVISEIKTEGKPAHMAYQKGLMQSEWELRKSVLSLAKAGSSPAQAMALDLLSKNKLKIMSR